MLGYIFLMVFPVLTIILQAVWYDAYFIHEETDTQGS